MDLKPLKIKYGYTDEDGNQFWENAEAATPIQAADILHGLRPDRWDVFTHDINGRKKDVTSQVHHILVPYIEPAYRDGRDYGPYSHQELRVK